IVEPGPFRTDFAGRSIRSAKRPIEAYADTAIARRRMIQGRSGAEVGNPVRAAEAIIAAVESKSPPLRLPLGNYAYDEMRAEIEAVRKEIEAGEAIARGADYPKVA
ncbi:MAG: short-chain dehydrogenase/reductase, partial [Hyphomicrobiales bacterium]|nr:short-chain dehydrogenase/reductase [Hyphomicrobiales bacterium]